MAAPACVVRRSGPRPSLPDPGPGPEEVSGSTPAPRDQGWNMICWCAWVSGFVVTRRAAARWRPAELVGRLPDRAQRHRRRPRRSRCRRSRSSERSWGTAHAGLQSARSSTPRASRSLAQNQRVGPVGEEGSVRRACCPAGACRARHGDLLAASLRVAAGRGQRRAPRRRSRHCGGEGTGDVGDAWPGVSRWSTASAPPVRR